MACYVHQETPGPQHGNVSEALEEMELTIKKISLFADGHSLIQDEKKSWRGTCRCVRYRRAEVGNDCSCQASNVSMLYP